MLTNNSQYKRTVRKGRVLLIHPVKGKCFILLLNENIKVGGPAFTLKTYMFLIGFAH